MNKTRQTEKVLEYIKVHGSINPWQAMQELHIMRLGARIWDLKESGIDITTTIRYKQNEDGTSTHWAEYSLAT